MARGSSVKLSTQVLEECDPWEALAAVKLMQRLEL